MFKSFCKIKYIEHPCNLNVIIKIPEKQEMFATQNGNHHDMI